MSKKKRKNSNYRSNAAAEGSKTATTGTRNEINKKVIIIAVSVVALIAILVGSMLIINSCTKTVKVEMSVKDYGKIIIELDESAAPKTVENFVSLVNDGFYDGLTFHRVMANFMIQGGDPDADGTGNGPNKIVGEFSKNGHNNPISHKRGVISMARSNAYNSASCQFFICNADSPHLDGLYAAFGRVVEGMEVVDAITEDYAIYNGVIYNKSIQPVIEYIKVID